MVNKQAKQYILRKQHGLYNCKMRPWVKLAEKNSSADTQTNTYPTHCSSWTTKVVDKKPFPILGAGLLLSVILLSQQGIAINTPDAVRCALRYIAACCVVFAAPQRTAFRCERIFWHNTVLRKQHASGDGKMRPGVKQAETTRAAQISVCAPMRQTTKFTVRQCKSHAAARVVTSTTTTGVVLLPDRIVD